MRATGGGHRWIEGLHRLTPPSRPRVIDRVYDKPEALQQTDERHPTPAPTPPPPPPSRSGTPLRPPARMHMDQHRAPRGRSVRFARRAGPDRRRPILAGIHPQTSRGPVVACAAWLTL